MLYSSGALMSTRYFAVYNGIKFYPNFIDHISLLKKLSKKFLHVNNSILIKNSNYKKTATKIHRPFSKVRTLGQLKNVIFSVKSISRNFSWNWFHGKKCNNNVISTAWMSASNKLLTNTTPIVNGFLHQLSKRTGKSNNIH